MTTRSIAMTAAVCVALTLPATAVRAQGTSSTATQTPAKPTTQKPTTQKPTTQKPAGTAAKPAGTKPKPAASTAKPAAAPAALRTPSKLKEKAPETYQVNFDTSVGSFVVDVTRSWAPIGADRFYNLVKNGFYDGNRFFRVLPGFVAQFGLYGDPKVGALWREATLPDEPVTQSNKRGTIVYAKAAAPNTRTTQLFINFRDNTRLDAGGFAPFGVVSSGMEIVDKINAEYGEAPDQGLIQEQGNAYLIKAFPKLDYIKKATIVKPVSK